MDTITCKRHISMPAKPKVFLCILFCSKVYLEIIQGGLRVAIKAAIQMLLGFYCVYCSSGQAWTKKELVNRCPVSRNIQAGLEHPFCQKFPLSDSETNLCYTDGTLHFLCSRFIQPTYGPTHQSVPKPSSSRDALSL